MQESTHKLFIDETPEPVVLLHVLVCRVGSTSVAFPLRGGDVVVPLPRLVELPEAPPWVRGTFRLRESSVVVIDVLGLFRRAWRPLSISDLVLVAKRQRLVYGLLVQEVHGVESLDPSSLEKLPATLALAPYCMGSMSGAGTEQILCIDIETLLERCGGVTLDA